MRKGRGKGGGGMLPKLKSVDKQKIFKKKY